MEISLAPPDHTIRVCSTPEEELDHSFFQIKCGEKIVVDFENEDGWTWRDEHSGPFSWMTRSQQDLTWDDLYHDSTPKDKTERKSFLSNDDTYGKDATDSAFLPGNTGLSEIEAAFHKFGITIPSNDDGDFAEYDTSKEFDSSDANDISHQSAFESFVVGSTHSDDSGHGKKKGDSKSDAVFMSLPLAQSTKESSQRDGQGHVSPVYEFDDVITSQPSTSHTFSDNDDDAYGAITSHVDSYVDAPTAAEIVTSPDLAAACEDSEVPLDSEGQQQQQPPLETYDNVPQSNCSSGDGSAVKSLDAATEPAPLSLGGVFIEHIGESRDDKQVEDDGSKSGFDFLDNW